MSTIPSPNQANNSPRAEGKHDSCRDPWHPSVVALDKYILTDTQGWEGMCGVEEGKVGKMRPPFICSGLDSENDPRRYSNNLGA